MYIYIYIFSKPLSHINILISLYDIGISWYLNTIGSPLQNEAELLILNSDGLEVKAEDDVSAAVLGASTASVPLVALEAAAPQGSLGQIR
jgi:hypothetical protein